MNSPRKEIHDFAANTTPAGRQLLALGLTAAVAVSANWIAAASGEILLHVLDAMSDVVESTHNAGLAQWAYLGISTSVFILASISLYDLSRHLFAARQVSCRVATESDARSCLIFFVSREGRFNPKFQRFDEWLDVATWKVCDPVSGVQVPLTFSLGTDITALDAFKEPRFWAWQQMLRGLEPHLPRLERVWLIGSGGSDGSYHDLTRCRLWLERYGLTGRVQVDDAVNFEGQHGVNFENFQELKQRLDDVIRREKELAGTDADRRIVIDATGGQKTTSIAAAAATLNSDVVFQYVQTNHPKKPVIYDITYDSPFRSG